MSNKKQFSILVIGLLVLMVALVGGEVAHADTGVFINEIHYDNTGGDAGEAIEIAGPAGTDLTGWTIALYNGSSSQLNVYDTIALNGVIPDQQNGFGTLSFSKSGIQNGAPDGMALIDSSSTVVQFLSYEGSFTAASGPAAGVTSTDIGVAEGSSTPVGHSLQLAGTGSVYEDFTWTVPAANTFGAVNTGQTFVGGDTPPTVSSITPADSETNVVLDADININFSEDVTVTGAWFDITCTASGVHTAAVTGGPQNYTLNPDTDFSNGETCTVTIVAAQVTDQDGTPDNMAADYVSSFTTATGVATNLVINEIHADPDAVNGDANGDGDVDTYDDEFVEIVNNSDNDVDISDWTLSDAVDLRHTFPAGTVVSAHCAIVVFGGGSPAGTFGGVVVQTASTGSLGLNNSGDTVTLNDGSTNQATANYGSVGGDNQSLTLDPDITGASFVKHSTATGSNGTLFSPGTMIDGSSFAGCGPVLGNCGDSATLIHDVQGNGATSPLSGTLDIVVEGVVVGDFQGTGKLRGFFLQEEDGQADSDSATSEGIFVYDGSFPTVDVNVGDVVRVEGEVDEFYDMTQLTNVSSVEICPSSGVATAATVNLPVASVNDWEWYEGMLINIPQTLYATGNYYQGRYGEVDLSVGDRLDNPTNVVEPGAPAIALQDLNDRSRIQLEDGRTTSNPVPVPYIGADGTLRAGDTIPELTGVLNYAYGAYEVHPTGAVNFTRLNAREPIPPPVGTTVKVASFNVLNYFSTIDPDPSDDSSSTPDNPADNICGPAANLECRGADSADEFTRQRNKIISAIVTMNADVIGLMEIENHPTDAALQDLVNGLNAVAGAGTYAYINTGPIGTDAIKVAFIYKPSVVTPDGAYAVLDSSVDPTFIDTRNRPALAQTFAQNADGEKFTAAVNHLKSKGSACDDIGDPDTGDGQGNCNLTRKSAAIALVNWLAGDPTSSGDDDFLIIGDLNSYAKEDPIDAIKAGGYTDLLKNYLIDPYTYVYSGQAGYLDHALANPSLAGQVSGVAIWHINTDEPAVLDYDDYNQPAGLYNPDQYRASDHDPVIVGLNLVGKPTAVSLVSFKVEADNGQAVIGWETGTEIDNAGFNLYRSISPDGPWFKLNASLIAAEGDPISGASYTFVDTPGRGTFYYRLEDVDYFGLSTQHNPVMAELGVAVRVPWFQPSLPEFY